MCSALCRLALLRSESFLRLFSHANFTTTFNKHDWIRKNNPRKPETYKIHKAYTILEQEYIKPELNDVIPFTRDSLNTDVYNAVNKSISQNLSRYFAVVLIAGKQFKITRNDLILVKSPIYGTDIGDRIRLEKVLLVGSDDFTLIGRPLLSKSQVYVEATIAEKSLEHPKIWFQFHRRRRHRRLRVFQDNVTLLHITNIQPNLLDLSECVN